MQSNEIVVGEEPARTGERIATGKHSAAMWSVGFGLCAMLSRSHAQPRDTHTAQLVPGVMAAVRVHAGKEEVLPALMDGHFAVQIPKQMKKGVSVLARVVLWDKATATEARAILSAKDLVAADVSVGRLVRVELIENQRGDFAIHALRPGKQLTETGHAVVWEWSIVPLKAGDHELSIVATNLADASGRPLDQSLRAMVVKIAVEDGRAPAPPSRTAEAPQPALQIEHRPDATPEAGKQADAGASAAANPEVGKFAAFFNRLKREVAAEWHPEELQDRLAPRASIYGIVDRRTVLQVALEPAGKIVSLQIARSSGVDFLDDEAMSAFRRAAPFANPPKDLVGSDGRIRFKFGFIVGGVGRMMLKILSPPKEEQSRPR
jgi:TonB family protein